MVNHTSASDQMLQSLEDGNQNKRRRGTSAIVIANQLVIVFRKTQFSNVGQALHNVRTLCQQKIQQITAINSQTFKAEITCTFTIIIIIMRSTSYNEAMTKKHTQTHTLEITHFETTKLDNGPFSTTVIKIETEISEMNILQNTHLLIYLLTVLSSTVPSGIMLTLKRISPINRVLKLAPVISRSPRITDK